MRYIKGILFAFVSLLYMPAAECGEEPAMENPNGPPLAHAEYALFFMGTYPADILQKVEAHANEAKLAFVDGPTFKGGARTPTLVYDLLEIEKYKPIDEESRRYMSFNVSAAELAQAQKSKTVLILTTFIPQKDLYKIHHQFELVLHSLAKESSALIWDQTVRLLFTAASWESYRLRGWQDDLPDMRSQVHMHAYRNGRLIRIVTLGMKKLLLPDLVLEDVASGHTRMAADLINCIGQVLIEGVHPKQMKIDLDLAKIKHNRFREMTTESRLEGHLDQVPIKFQWVDPDEGDSDNILMTIDIEEKSNDEIQMKQLKLFNKVFGSEGIVHGVRNNDQELERVSAQARKQLLAIKSHFLNGIPLNERLIVKAPFSHLNETEWMWVELVCWKDDTIEGILMNTPRDLPNYSAGAQVKVKESEIFDYLWTKADGTIEGNETGKIIERRYR